jgi:hypothetical protein
MVYSCGHAPATVASVNDTTGVLQLSVAVAIPVFAGAVLAEHSIVTFAGQNVITGGVLSSMTITWVQVLMLPQASVAFHVRVMVYSCGQAPATVASVNDTTGVLQLSVAVAIPVFAGVGLTVHWIVTFGGQNVITGGVLSSTMITCTQAVLLPQLSVAVQVLLIVYSCGHTVDGIILSL